MKKSYEGLLSTIYKKDKKNIKESLKWFDAFVYEDRHFHFKLSLSNYEIFKKIKEVLL